MRVLVTSLSLQRRGDVLAGGARLDDDHDLALPGPGVVHVAVDAAAGEQARDGRAEHAVGGVGAAPDEGDDDGEHEQPAAATRRPPAPPAAATTVVELAAGLGCRRGPVVPGVVTEDRVGEVLVSHVLVPFVRGLRRRPPTGSPAGDPVVRSVSRADWRMSTAAAWSTTARCRLPATPLSRSVRCASTVRQPLVDETHLDRCDTRRQPRKHTCVPAVRRALRPRRATSAGRRRRRPRRARRRARRSPRRPGRPPPGRRRGRGAGSRRGWRARRRGR